jgi:hypothetical protein
MMHERPSLQGTDMKDSGEREMLLPSMVVQFVHCTGVLSRGEKWSWWSCLCCMQATHKGLPRHCGALWDRHGQLLEALHAWNCFQAPRSGVTLLIVIMDQSTSFCLSKTWDVHHKRLVKQHESLTVLCMCFPPRGFFAFLRRRYPTESESQASLKRTWCCGWKREGKAELISPLLFSRRASFA